MKIKVVLALLAVLVCAAPAAAAAEAQELLPQSGAWQPYIDNSPIDPRAFAADPLGELAKLLPADPLAMARQAARGYASTVMFIVLAAALSFLASGTAEAQLLELASAAGCGILLWGSMAGLTAAVCEKAAGWQSFLLGFLPVYAGVLTAGGETAAAASTGGLMLTLLCFLGQLVCAGLEPLLQCYLALSLACCVSSEAALTSACALAGKTLRQGLKLAGGALAVLLSVQRIFTLQLDRSAVRACRLLTGSIPIIGQTLSGAAETALSGLQLAKGWLGLAAIAVLGVEFVPLYIELLLHCALLKGCGLLCSFAGIGRCRALFECLAQAVQCMAAAAALFCGIAAFGTALMMAAGGG